MHPTRGRAPSEEATAQNARSLARMQDDLDTWPNRKEPRIRKLRSALAYIHSMNSAALDKLILRVEELLAEALKVEEEKSRSDYHAWVSRALENGSGLAHRWTVQEPKAPPLPTYIQVGDRTLYHPLDKASHYKEYWDGHWGRYKDQQGLMVNAIKAMSTMASGMVGTLPPITSFDVKEGIKEISLGTALGLDQWDVSWLRSLGEDSRQNLK